MLPLYTNLQLVAMTSHATGTYKIHLYIFGKVSSLGLQKFQNQRQKISQVEVEIPKILGYFRLKLKMSLKIE